MNSKKASNRDWESVKSLGVMPLVDSLEKYDGIVEEGTALAKEYLRKQTDKAFTVEEILVAHGLMYKDVHPWAGCFREPDLIPGNDGKAKNPKGAHHDNIENALEMMKTEFNETSKATVIEEAKSIAKYHHRFLSAEPFLGDNGLLGRTIMDVQSKASSLNAEVSPMLDTGQYKDALKQMDANPENTKRMTELIIDATNSADKSRIEKTEQLEREAKDWLKNELDRGQER